MTSKRLLALWVVLSLLVNQPLIAERLTVVHTNDLHSQVEGSGPDRYFTPEAGDGDPIRGHFARLGALIGKIRSQKEKEREPVIAVDAGDFFSGSLFHLLSMREDLASSPEWDFFQHAGFDAVTLGNHEFDGGLQGLSCLLRKAGNIPVVASNLKQALPPVDTLPTFLIKEVVSGDQTLRIGILGALGPDGIRSSAPHRQGVSFVGFDDEKDRMELDSLRDHLQEKVAALKKERADFVVLLLHGGSPEDEALAMDGVDLIVAGHTHEPYFTPKKVGQTWIVQAGAYGEFLGKIEFQKEEGHWVVRNASTVLVPIDDQLPADAGYLENIAKYKGEISGQIQSTQLSYDTPVTRVNKSLARTSQFGDPLGRQITSAVRTEINKRLEHPIDVYVTSLGLIRNGFRNIGGPTTLYQFSDIFRILPIGFGEGFSAGSPIVTFSLSQGDFSKLVNFFEIYRYLSDDFTPVYSDSLQFKLRKWGVPFINRISQIKINDQPMSSKELIRVGTSQYVASYLSRVETMSRGWVKVQMLDVKGQPLTKASTEKLPSEAFLFAHALKQDLDLKDSQPMTSQWGSPVEEGNESIDTEKEKPLAELTGE